MRVCENVKYRLYDTRLSIKKVFIQFDGVRWR